MSSLFLLIAILYFIIGIGGAVGNGMNSYETGLIKYIEMLFIILFWPGVLFGIIIYKLTK